MQCKRRMRMQCKVGMRMQCKWRLPAQLRMQAYCTYENHPVLTQPYGARLLTATDRTSVGPARSHGHA